MLMALAPSVLREEARKLPFVLAENKRVAV